MKEDSTLGAVAGGVLTLSVEVDGEAMASVDAGVEEGSWEVLDSVSVRADNVSIEVDGAISNSGRADFNKLKVDRGSSTSGRVDDKESKLNKESPESEEFSELSGSSPVGRLSGNKVSNCLL